MSLLPASSSGEVSTGFYNGVATQSLRFDDGNSSHLTFTPSSASSAEDIAVKISAFIAILAWADTV